MELVQPQLQNTVGNFQAAQANQDASKLSRIQMAAAQQEMQQKQYTQGVLKAAAAGHPEAMKILSAVNPAAAKGLRDEEDYRAVTGAKILDSYFALPRNLRNQRAWDSALKEYKQATGKEPNMPNSRHNAPDDPVSDEVEDYAKSTLVRLKGREQELKEQKEVVGIAETKAKTITERMQPAKISADIQKTRADTGKVYEDLAAAKQERERAAAAGLSPTAYKKGQEVFGEAAAKNQIALPKLEEQANYAIKLVNEIKTHKGMSDVVGAKNLFSGAVKQHLPDWAGGEKPIAGTRAANFMAKFDQLKGKQFLEAYETLKGGGSITEVEGTKATNAISSMQTAQSEKEFKNAADEFIKVIQTGLERAKKGIKISPNQTPNIRKYNIETGRFE